MAGERMRASEEPSSRRSVVPDAAGRSPWLAAVWTGLGATVVCATVAIVAVAVLWLPVSGTTGRTTSAIRAGLLTFLASVHGGITVDGVAAAWLPLGLVLVVGVVAWRAGSGLADAADALGERDPLRLMRAGLTQAASFTVGCLLARPFATLGTSHAPFLGVAVGSFVLFSLTGGVAFARSSALAGWCADRAPSWAAPVGRAAAAAVVVYLLAGALTVAGSLVVHHGAVTTLSGSFGGGWDEVPILVLGLLAAPNAAIAGAAYLAGPGFAVGTGTSVTLFGTAHGTLPAFPLLAALPGGHGADPAVWAAAVLTALVAGVVVARLAARSEGLRTQLAVALGAALAAGTIMFLLAWQGGGRVAGGRLATVGASPWRLGGAVTAAVAAVSVVTVAITAAVRALRTRREDEDDEPLLPLRRLLIVPSGEHDERGGRDDKPGGHGELAG